jgi:hypothetical protein
VTGGVAELRSVVGAIVGGAHVVLALVEDARLVGGVAEGGQGDVSRAGEPVHPGDLAAVIGGDGQLDDPRPGVEELEDDLGVEVEVVGVELQREPGQRRDAVEPIAEWNSERCVPRTLFWNVVRIRLPTNL